MANVYLGRRLRLLGHGLERVKEDAVASADDDLFAVYGLNLITLMYGEVTGVGDGGATTIALNEKTDSIPICAATTVTGDAVWCCLACGYAGDGVSPADRQKRRAQEAQDADTGAHVKGRR
jgi:hypothetical protein